MRRSLIVLALLVAGCAIPAEVKDKIATEAAIHQGYERFVDTASVDSLRSIVRTSSAAWQALNAAVNPPDTDQ